MPVSIHTKNSHSLTTITLNGEVPLNEFLDLIHRYKDSGYSKYEIYDLRNFTGPPLSFNDVKTLANYIYDLDPLRPKGGKSAIIHDRNDPLGFGVSKQLISILESENVTFELNVFYSKEEAHEWLAICPSLNDDGPPS